MPTTILMTQFAKNPDTLWEYIILLHLGKCSSVVMYRDILPCIVPSLLSITRDDIMIPHSVVLVTNFKVSTIIYS